MELVHAFALFMLAAVHVAATTSTNEEIFSRPVISRAYEQNQWVLRDETGTGLREDASSVGNALAGLNPSYVSGLIYLQSETQLDTNMTNDWNTIRSLVPNAKFDVEISLNPKKHAFASGDALVAKMTEIHKQLSPPPDGWWFDFYSSAPSDWVTAAINYAHNHSQTVGGNIFDDKVPAGTDAFAFVDKNVTGSKFGFDFNRAQVSKLKAAANGAAVLGHLQSNAQNGAKPTNECYVYTQKWSEAERYAYLEYWASEQCQVGFTFMYPVFYPLYPGAVAWDPLTDKNATGTSLYSQIEELMSNKC